jgi:hypothetical protein
MVNPPELSDLGNRLSSNHYSRFAHFFRSFENFYLLNFWRLCDSSVLGKVDRQIASKAPNDR